MPARLYLDAARLGLMTPSAQQALRHFVRFTAEEGCSLYFEKLYYHGFPAWPATLQTFYFGLKHWRGIAGLKASLAKLAEAPNGSGPMVANRSTALMRLAAKLLVERCRRVLSTDLAWPAYAGLLEQEACSGQAHVVSVPLRTAILDEKIPASEVISRISTIFHSERCDGLFLPAVSCDGIRLPVEAICRALGHPRQPKFVVVDGAQALCHTGCRPGIECADIYLTGCHKWFDGGSVPLGVAFSGRRRSRPLIHATVRQMLANGQLDDALLRFITEIETGRVSRFSETVSLASLFAAQAAAADWMRERTSLPRFFECQLENAHRVALAASELGWEPLCPTEPLRSGILLLRAEDAPVRRMPADTLRQRFQQHEIALTAYDGGVIRLSMPQTALQFFEMDWIRSALKDCGNADGTDEIHVAEPLRRWAG